MRRIYILLFLALSGILGASAQKTDLGSILSKLSSAGAAKDSTSTGTSAQTSGLGGVLGSLLSNVLGNDKIATDDMVGSWTYSSPAVAFKSDDLLKKAGGAAASAAVEQKLAEYYKIIGFTGMTLTVGDDKSFTMKSSRLSLSGTIEQGAEPGEIIFSFKALKKIPLGSYTAHVSIVAGRMTVTFDTTKLMSLVNTVAKFAGSKSLSAMNSILQQFDGMEAGFAMTKNK
ncbi:DUF4923 family protein [uncultured Muribaculum sp.]|uniref:lipocalin-like domain-containing protein n=1 Tax=uncultured Muribaculum sp. TaxID=1918613 RepID=UPI0025E6AEA6|nr:DUF4923 family protein [uncultured Muribaculum sp.]